mgnify:CR=1 FL=1
MRIQQKYVVIISITTSLLIWEGIVRFFNISHGIFPPFSSVLSRIFLSRNILFIHLSYTLIEILLGFGIAFLTGIFLSLLFDRISPLKNFLYPLLVSFQSVPKIALAPLFVIWFGYGLMPKIVMAAFISFFPILIGAMAGLSSYEEEMEMFMDMLNASWWKRIWKIKLPIAIPHIMTGCKVSITLAVVGAIIGEFVNPSKGLGYIIEIGKENFDTSLQFGAILLVSIMGWLLFELIGLIEKLFFKKYQTTSSEQNIGATYV